MEWLVAVAFGVYFLSGVRVVSERERIAVHRLGLFAGFKKPGLRYKVPGAAGTWSRLMLGMRGEALSPDLGIFDQAEVPIEASLPLRQGQYIRVDGFSDSKASVVLDPIQTRTLRCARCGHENPVD